MAFVQDPLRKRFMGLTEAVGDIIEEQTNKSNMARRPQLAPEHERGGSA
jgi:hypothetical protein